MSSASITGRRRFGRIRHGRRTTVLAVLLAAIALSGCALGRTLPATEAVLDGATLNGTVFSNISEDADYFFEYGKPGSAGSQTATHRVSVSPSSEYRCRSASAARSARHLRVSPVCPRL